MTKESFLSFYTDKTTKNAASACYDAVSKALSDIGILTPMTLIGALATVRTEVGRGFLPVRENTDGKAYELRTKDLGNYCPGDGFKYRGGGYIQLTGRKNYEAYGAAIGADIVCHPDLTVTDISVSAAILARYFKDRGIQTMCDNRQWKDVRYAVNGGYNGLDTFLSVIDQYLFKA